MKFSFFKRIIAALMPILLLVGCSSNEKIASDIAPSEILKAVTDEIAFNSSVIKDKSELETYYKGIDVSKVDDAALSLSVGHPDEIAIIKFKSSKDAEAAEPFLKARLENQIKTYKDYPLASGDMTKLESAKIYSLGCYAILLAAADNDKAKSIVDAKLKN